MFLVINLSLAKARDRKGSEAAMAFLEITIWDC